MWTIWFGHNSKGGCSASGAIDKLFNTSLTISRVSMLSKVIVAMVDVSTVDDLGASIANVDMGVVQISSEGNFRSAID